MAAFTKFSYALHNGTGLFVYTSRARRDGACAECKYLEPISAVRARTHMRESLINELWATPSDFQLGGDLVNQDVLTKYYMQMVSQLG